MQFYGSKLSENIGETPEGYLICRNVQIGRIGEQDYLGQELNLNDKYDETVKVYRLPEDVFDKVSMASFEGKPFTDNHPQEHVTVDNAAMYSKGHIQNIRRDGDYLVGDIIVMDPNVISMIKNDLKREISLGYDCYYEPYLDGYRQTRIRGNHVAIVNKGRAGSHVCIKDHKPEIRRDGMSKRTKVLAAMLKSYAKDASPEEVADAMEVMGEEAKEESTPVKDEEEKGILAKIKDMFEGKPEEGKPTEDEESSVEARLAKLEDSVSKLMEAEKSENHPELEDSEPENEDIIEDEEELEEEVTDEDEEEEEIKVSDSAIKNLRRAICKISDAGERKMVSDALRVSLRQPAKKNGYAIISDAMKKHAMVSDEDRVKNLENLGKKIAAKFNPHFNKGE